VTVPREDMWDIAVRRRYVTSADGDRTLRPAWQLQTVTGIGRSHFVLSVRNRRK